MNEMSNFKIRGYSRFDFFLPHSYKADDRNTHIGLFYVTIYVLYVSMWFHFFSLIH
jgi:hypothetical protein